ncbi:ATP-binding protein [Corallococcus macrosporus]|uniref:histidine kinase n=1 Tax=Corallococcus macrosporus DSM 14697 TaxID=1189310 RepID=A0A286NW73_9BACT|nr:ATP-binding protein [Corallococcus macrosporus]ATB51418.1 hybrid sensor histidine kinase/response regulator [Corallococcus macrosporus DSM 14697]
MSQGLRLSRRSGVLAAGALLLLCGLFAMGRPWATSDNDRYRGALRHLRVASGDLELDVLRERLGLRTLHGVDAEDFAALRARADALRRFPSFLSDMDRRTMNAALDLFVSALDERAALLERARAADARGEKAEADAALQALLEGTASARADRVINTYLELYERTQGRNERSRIVFFIVSLALVAYVLVVMVRLSSATAELATLNADLERRVEERTRALSAANDELRASEARKAAILEASPDGILPLDGGEGPPRFTAFVRDITERKEVERMKNEFISTVSHELRTPLTSIRGSLGLLEGGVMGELPPRAVDLVRIARTNTERLIRLINDSLDLEKMEAGRLELKVATLECAELVEATFAGVKGVADGAGVALHAEVAGTPRVSGDRDRLVQVLTNLVSNAVKFSPRGAEVTVRVAEDASGRVRFSVADPGPGLSPEQRARLFGRFQQLDSSDTRSKGGTGLGLALSQAIVEQHGSRISVESEEGRGSTFSFTLEAVKPALAAAPPYVPEDASRYDVLVTTADAELAALLRGLLSHEGYRVLSATNLAEAARHLDAALPDALVVDMQLPDGQALDWVRRLREQPRTHELPVLALSGRADHAEGVPHWVDWMPRPLEESRLLESLRYATRQPGQARVLVVDDDAGTRRTLCAQLERLGVHVFEAADGESAVELARETTPDLIVLDVGLPRLDGFEVVDILRQGRGRATPLIVFTGRDLTRMDERQLTLGITRHFTKSRASEEELVASVRDLLSGLLARKAHPS